MKIGILSQWFPPETGPASIPGVLARRLVHRGHNVSVLTGFPNYPTGVIYNGYRNRLRHDSEGEGYTLRRVLLYPDHSDRITGRMLNYGSFAASASALGTAVFKDVDVLWVYNSPATVALPMWLAQKRFHVPIVLHNMDMWPDSVVHAGFSPRRGGQSLIRGLNRWVDKMYQSSTFVAYVTPSAGAELRRRGVPPSKLAYSPVWVDETVFRPCDGGPLRKQLGFSDSDIVVGYAGAIGKAQSVVELATAVSLLPTSSPIKCLILGAGTEAARIQQIANLSGGKVRFIGQVAHEAMTEYAAVPDICFVGLSAGGRQAFAAPSKIPAIMASGKPLLAAVDGDSADLVRRSAGGLVVSPDDAKALRLALEGVAGKGRAGLAQLGATAQDYYLSNLSTESGVSRIERLLYEAVRQRNVPAD